MKTTQVTLRNVSADLKKRIDQASHKQKVSINTHLVGVLEDYYGIRANKPGWRDSAGILQSSDIDQNVIDDFRKVDESMWR